MSSTTDNIIASFQLVKTERNEGHPENTFLRIRQEGEELVVNIESQRQDGTEAVQELERTESFSEAFDTFHDAQIILLITLSVQQFNSENN